MRAGREADDQYRGVRIAERGNGTPPINAVGVCPALGSGDVSAVLSQPHAPIAGDDAGVELGESTLGSLRFGWHSYDSKRRRRHDCGDTA